MTPNQNSEAPAGSPTNPIPLPTDKKLLKEYYDGGRLDSPMGGQLDLLGVREGEEGEGKILFECNVSSLRFVLTIPKATRTEKKKVKDALAEHDEALCPRHGLRQRLVKAGKEWVCPLCGVSFGKGP
jgi:hypothetical protein